MSGGGAGMGQHVWGAGGQRLVGDLLDNVVLPHQNQDPRQLAGLLLLLLLLLLLFFIPSVGIFPRGLRKN